MRVPHLSEKDTTRAGDSRHPVPAFCYFVDALHTTSGALPHHQGSHFFIVRVKENRRTLFNLLV